MSSLSVRPLQYRKYLKPKVVKALPTYPICSTRSGQPFVLLVQPGFCHDIFLIMPFVSIAKTLTNRWHGRLPLESPADSIVDSLRLTPRFRDALKSV